MDAGQGNAPSNDRLREVEYFPTSPRDNSSHTSVNDVHLDPRCAQHVVVDAPVPLAPAAGERNRRAPSIAVADMLERICRVPYMFPDLEGTHA